MTKLLAQHGSAKGSKISDSLDNNNLSGVIFSPNDESMESIKRYFDSNDNLNHGNTFLDPQFYYSTFESSILKKLSDLEQFPSNIARRDWRKKSPELIGFLDYHAEVSRDLSNTLITPGFFIDNIDWHFDYSIDIYNYCVNQYNSEHEFRNYALSLLVNTSFFNNTDNVNELIEELNEMCDVKDYLYFTLCHDGNKDNNYEEMDANSLANILFMIYELQKSGFKFILGYTFMNSLLFSMIGCDYVASGWFNTLRKFQKTRFELVDSFGRRKKRYTSIPLLSNIMFDDIKIMLDSNAINIENILSETEFDLTYEIDEDQVSFVDLEHQYWESINKGIQNFEDIEDINEKIELMNSMIENALSMYQTVIQTLDSRNEKEAVSRIRTASKHLGTWLAAIDKFKTQALIL